MPTEDATPTRESRRRDSSTSRRVTLSTTRRERKRESDRVSQQATRARTKAYIANLERTLAGLVEVHAGDGAALSKQLKEQYEEIESLKEVIARISRLASGATGLLHAEPDAEVKSQSSRHLSSSSPHENVRENSVTFTPAGQPGRIASDTFKPAPRLDQKTLNQVYPMLNLECGSQDRDYFEVLNQAFVTIECNHTRHLFQAQKLTTTSISGLYCMVGMLPKPKTLSILGGNYCKTSTRASSIAVVQLRE